jgi:hypothetical protein
VKSESGDRFAKGRRCLGGMGEGPGREPITKKWSFKAQVMSIGSKASLSMGGDSKPQAERRRRWARSGVGSAEVFEAARSVANLTQSTRANSCEDAPWSLVLSCIIRATDWADAPRWGGRLLHCWLAAPLPLPRVLVSPNSSVPFVQSADGSGWRELGLVDCRATNLQAACFTGDGRRQLHPPARRLPR